MSKGLEKRVKCVVADNTGAKEVQLWGFYNNKKVAKIGETVKGSIKKCAPNMSVKKKQVYKMRIVRTNYKQLVHNMFHVRFFQNAVILLNEKEEQLGTRMSGITSSILIAESQEKRNLANKFDEVL